MYFFVIKGTDVMQLSHTLALVSHLLPALVRFSVSNFLCILVEFVNFSAQIFRVVPWLYFLLLQEQLFTNSNMIKNYKPYCYYTS